MSAWTLIQVAMDLFFGLSIFVVLMRMNRAPKDDPRLSRGLQLLQAKISVLEDLSDRTETQVNQLVAILDNKSREVQAKVQLAEQQVGAIKVSMDRSLEVAKIFQDKIPHQEILERQNTIKYVTAARLAHNGSSVDEIAHSVDLPKGEIEFIASVNRERLMFKDEELPDWAREHAAAGTEAALNEAAISQEAAVTPAAAKEKQSAARFRAEIELAERQKLVENLNRLQFEMKSLDQELARDPAMRAMDTAFDVPKLETTSLAKLGNEFRQAVKLAEANSDVFIEDKPAWPAADELRSTVASATEAAPLKVQAVDQATARALAQEKVRATLRASAPPAKPAPSAELAAAREAAKKAAASGPVVRKVVFPRIEDER